MMLINSTLQAIPRYLIHAFYPLPNIYLIEIGRNLWKIFLGGLRSSRKHNWVSWKNMCMPKSIAGLGLLTNNHINLIILARLCWKIENKLNWAANFLFEKYVRKREEPVNFTKGSHIWNSIAV